MPHADTSLVPPDIQTKEAFYQYVSLQLKYLLEGQRNWISNLSNAASLLYHSFLSFPSHFGSDRRSVNWVGEDILLTRVSQKLLSFSLGFYLEAAWFPNSPEERSRTEGQLLLGPFAGKPACQFIRAQQGKGVCADAFVSQETVVVDDVEAYPCHIACDGATKSEIVLPIIVNGHAVGVLDLDCLVLGGFSEEDQIGLENIVKIIVDSCDWDVQ